MKRISFLSFLFVLFLSSSVLFAQTQIQSGNFSANSKTPGYTLDKNSGDRSVTIEVSFEKAFEKKPQVVISITSIDVDTKSNVRYSIEPGAVSRDGFTITIKTWSETKIFGIGGSWIAHAE